MQLFNIFDFSEQSNYFEQHLKKPFVVVAQENSFLFALGYLNRKCSCILKMLCNFFCVVYNFRSLEQKHAPLGLWVLCGVRQGSLGFVTELLISDFGRAKRIRTVGAMIEWLVCVCVYVCECIIWHFNVHRKYTKARKKPYSTYPCRAIRV